MTVFGQLLREKELFPLLAVLKTDNEHELARWEVTKIERGLIENAAGLLFKVPRVPEKFYRIDTRALV